MSDSEFFDSDKAVAAIGGMWRALAEHIVAHLPEVVTERGDPVRAVKWATCAEACFWKATGEADPHDVKDVLKSDGPTQTPDK